MESSPHLCQCAVCGPMVQRTMKQNELAGIGEAKVDGNTAFLFLIEGVGQGPQPGAS